MAGGSSSAWQSLTNRHRAIMNRILKYIVTAILLTMTALTVSFLQSCINDKMECPSEVEENEDGFHLRFTIMTKTDGRTRAADIDGDQEGAGYENYIDVNDIKYLIFDKNQRFITDITAKTKTVAANGNYTVYNVEATVNDPYFYNNITGNVDFYLLALANHKEWNITVPTLKKGDDLEMLFTDGLVMKAIPQTSLLQSGVISDVHFPMSGLQYFSVPGSMLLTSGKEAPYDISLATGKDLNMLRALVKIEIIDKINIADDGVFNDAIDNQGENGYLRIDKVEINGFMSRGSLLPAFAQWSKNSVLETQQVDAPTIPSSALYKLPPILGEDNKFGSFEGFSDYSIDFLQDEYASSLRKDKCPVFSGYVYEYLKTADQMQEVPATQQPYFRVTTRGHSENGVVVAESMVLPLRMAKYTNGTAASADNFPQLLRNHIYRFEISGIGSGLTVNWTVCEMDAPKDPIVIPPFN